MASSGVNVLRYTALFTGIAYGFSHQSSLTAQTHRNHVEAEHKQQENLVQQAKAEWAKKTAPPSSSGAVITDSSNPQFDLEALVSKVADGSIQV